MKEYLLISECLLGVPCRYDCKSKPLPKETLAGLNEKFTLVAVCPEMAGGLPAPRVPAERLGDRVVRKDGVDVTENYRRGASEALALVNQCHITKALLKERSPSCGAGKIYDGSFSGVLINGDGVTAEMLKKEGVQVFGESEIEKIM